MEFKKELDDIRNLATELLKRINDLDNDYHINNILDIDSVDKYLIDMEDPYWEDYVTEINLNKLK